MNDTLTVRGRIKDYIERHRHLLTDPVLEVGSRLPDVNATWALNRGKDNKNWIGIDIQEGCNVDMLMSMGALTFQDNLFNACLCSEVLEHVENPAKALREIYRVLEKGGNVLITTMFAFPIHNYPSDYWRFTPEGLVLLLEQAGFSNVEVETAGEISMDLNDHGEEGMTTLTMPIHVFARGKKV